MSTFVANQTYVFLIFILIGAIIGLLFDFFRILRRSFKTPDFITYIEDILFWILTCVLLAYTILKYNNGEIRLYLFIGLFIGITLYILILSKYIIKICTVIIITIKNITKIMYNYIKYPIKIILNLLRKLLFKPISFICINFKKNLSNLIKKSQKILSKKSSISVKKAE